MDTQAGYPREVGRRALELSASAIILVHNHPSGDPQLATQVFAWTYGFDAILGWGVPLPGETKAYPPWRILVWRRAFGEAQPEAFSSSAFLILLGAMAGLGIGSLTRGKGAHPFSRARD